jgi:hypothetical protein
LIISPFKALVLRLARKQTTFRAMAAAAASAAALDPNNSSKNTLKLENVLPLFLSLRP